MSPKWLYVFSLILLIQNIIADTGTGYFSLPSLPKPNLPNLPNLNLPKPNLPNLPNLNLPKPNLPNLNLPTLPSLPDINLPELPSLPSLPNLPNLPNLPSFPDLPNIPNSLGDLIDKATDLSVFDKIFYDPITRLGLKGKLENLGRDRFGIGFSGVSCKCKNLNCGCCTGMNLNIINFNNRACTNFTLHPEEFAIKFKFTVNDKEIYTNTVSGKNPEPFCIPFYPPFLSFCVRFYDIFLTGPNMHACVDLQTIVVKWPILTLHFDCLTVGMGGISWTKPGENSIVPAFVPPAMAMSEINAPEVYDEVNFEMNPTDLPSNQNILTLTEEDNIGQLKV